MLLKERKIKQVRKNIEIDATLKQTRVTITIRRAIVNMANRANLGTDNFPYYHHSSSSTITRSTKKHIPMFFSLKLTNKD